MITKAAPRRGDIACSYAAERALIGCVLLDEWEVWGEVGDVGLIAEDFMVREHQAIWKACERLRDSGEDVTLVSVACELERIGVIDAVDSWIGPPYLEPYLAEAQAEQWSAKGCSSFAREVKRYADQRIGNRARREIVL